MSKRRNAPPVPRASAPTFAPPPLPSFLGPLLAFLILILVVAVVHAPVLLGDLLLWDDSVNVTANPYLHPPSWDHFFALWREPYAGLYVPVTYSFLMFETYFANELSTSTTSPGQSAFIYHLGNLTIHLLNVTLVFVLGRRITSRWSGGFVAGLWFGLHPLQCEAVAWVTEAKALLSGFFSFAAILLFLPSDKPESQSDKSSRARTAIRYFLASVLFVLALLAKPTAVAVPIIAGVIAAWNHAVPWRRGCWMLVPWLGIAAGLAVLTSSMQATPATDTLPIWSRPLVAGDALTFYLWKLIAPFPLTFDYGRTPSVVLAGWFAYVAWFIPLLLAILLASVKSWRVWLFPFAIFVAGLLPSLGLIPFTFQTFSTVADRYVYLAMLGPSLGVGYWWTRRGTKTRAFVLTAAFLVFAVLSHRQSKVWRNDLSLNQQGIAVNPRSRAAHNNLAAALLARNQGGQAIEHYQAVFELANNPRIQAEALVGMGHALTQANQPSDAIEKYDEAIRLMPDLPPARLAKGSALLGMGKAELAKAEFESAVRIDPKLVEGHYNLALAWDAMGKPEEASKELDVSLSLRPGHAPSLIALGNLAYRAADYSDAAKFFRTALRHDPRNAVLHFNLANTLVRLGDRRNAIVHFQETLRLNPRMQAARRNLEILQRSRD